MAKEQNQISRRKIPLTDFAIVRTGDLYQLEERFDILEREFKDLMTSTQIRSKIDGHILTQIAETATEKVLAMKTQENRYLRSILSNTGYEHGRNLHIA